MDIFKIVRVSGTSTTDLNEGTLKKIQLRNSEEVEFVKLDDTVTFLNGEDERVIDEDIVATIHVDGEASDIIGYNGKLYSYFGPCSLELNKKYNLNLTVEENDFDFSVVAGYSPMYCKPKDVENLISSVLSTMGDVNLPYEIFQTSIRIDDLVEEANSKDSSSGGEKKKLTEKQLKKLAANMTARDLMYNFYYDLSYKAGTKKEKIGTLEDSKQHTLLVKLKDLIGRFEANIDIILGTIADANLISTFTKNKNGSTGLNERMW